MFARIRSFIAIAECASFRRACEEIGRSQPAISAHLQQLEDFLGVTLVSRTTREVRLTAIGQTFLAKAKVLVADYEALISATRVHGKIKCQRVVVAAIPIIALQWLPRVTIAFVSRFPNISVQVKDEIASMVERDVLTSEVDFGIGPIETKSADLTFHRMFKDRFIAVFHSNHPLSGRRNISLAELLNYPIISMVSGTNIRTKLDASLRKVGRKLIPAYEVSSHQTLGAMVQATLGVAILPSSTANGMLANNLESVKIVEPEISRDLGIIRRRGTPLSGAAQELLRTIEQFSQKERVT